MQKVIILLVLFILCDDFMNVVGLRGEDSKRGKKKKQKEEEVDEEAVKAAAEKEVEKKKVEEKEVEKKKVEEKEVEEKEVEEKKVEGKEVEEKEMIKPSIEAAPYAVSVFAPTGSGKYVVCTGVLVDVQWVLTVDSCFHFSGMNVSIYAGASSILDDETYQIDAIRFEIEQIFKFQNTSESNRFSELVLLKLKEPMVLSKAIGVLQIERESGRTLDKRNCLAVGFYIDLIKLYVMFTTKFYIEGELEESCRCYIKEKEEKKKIFCAKPVIESGNKCYFDVGSPLVCDNHLVGILDEMITVPNCDEKDFDKEEVDDEIEEEEEDIEDEEDEEEEEEEEETKKESAESSAEEENEEPEQKTREKRKKKRKHVRHKQVARSNFEDPAELALRKKSYPCVDTMNVYINIKSFVNWIDNTISDDREKQLKIHQVRGSNTGIPLNNPINLKFASFLIILLQLYAIYV